jgi:hypothetical protein
LWIIRRRVNAAQYRHLSVVSPITDKNGRGCFVR